MTSLFKSANFSCKNRDSLNLSQEKWGLLERSSGPEPNLQTTEDEAGLGVSASLQLHFSLCILFTVLYQTDLLALF